MRLGRFDLNLLVVLDALLEEGNVTRAAERLHIGQSAASNALARLREYFGDELLVQVGRQMAPTPLGRSLVAPVRDALLRARAALALTPDFDPATAERRFTVYASDYVTMVLLTQAVNRIAQEAPGVALDIRTPPRDVLDHFERGSVDFLVLPEQYLGQLEHPRQLLFNDTQVCVVWQGNKRVGEHLDFEQFMRLGHIGVRVGAELSLAFEEWLLPRHGRLRRVECSADNFACLPMLVIGNDRVITLPRRLATQHARFLPLRLIDPPFDPPSLSEVMVWPRYLNEDPAHQWVRDVLTACAQEMPA